MKGTNSAEELRETIKVLEEKHATQGMVLKEQLLVVADSIKPSNLLKYTFKEVAGSHDLLIKLVGTTIGLAAGHISNRAVAGKPGSTRKKLIGILMQYGIYDYIFRDTEMIYSLLGGIRETFFPGHRNAETQKNKLET